jgi:hypothetical protein
VPTGEIEQALLAHEAVAEAVALAKEDRPGEIRLIAYVVYGDGQPPTVSELRRHLRKRLPDHLVPANVVELHALPKGPDGRVRTEELADPFAPADTYVAPRTEMERAVAQIYQEALGLERVGAHDNFFDIGGHSLLALRVVNKIAKLTGVRLNQPAIVLQTVEQIAAECERQRTGGLVAPNGEGAARAAEGRDGQGGGERDEASEGKSLSQKLFLAMKDSLWKGRP